MKGAYPEKESTAEKEINFWLKKKGLAPDTFVFKVLGKYNCLREYLLSRGMVEHDWQPKYENHKFNSCVFHFLYTTKSRDAFNTPMLESQFTNHIAGTKGITTKVGLSHTMNNLIWTCDRDVNETFPSCFDLSNLEADDALNFMDYAKFN